MTQTMKCTQTGVCVVTQDRASKAFWVEESFWPSIRKFIMFLRQHFQHVHQCSSKPWASDIVQKNYSSSASTFLKITLLWFRLFTCKMCCPLFLCYSTPNGSQTIVACEGHFLHLCGHIAEQDFEQFSLGVDQLRSTHQLGTENGPKGSKSNPAFMLAIVNNVLGRYPSRDNNAQPSLPTSGFADVGQRKNSIHEDTCWPLIRETLKVWGITCTGVMTFYTCHRDIKGFKGLVLCNFSMVFCSVVLL